MLIEANALLSPQHRKIQETMQLCCHFILKSKRDKSFWHSATVSFITNCQKLLRQNLPPPYSPANLAFLKNFKIWFCDILFATTSTQSNSVRKKTPMRKSNSRLFWLCKSEFSNFNRHSTESRCSLLKGCLRFGFLWKFWSLWEKLKADS